MLCFLPPIPAVRPERVPGPEPHRAARATEAVIVIFLVLNLLFVLTGLLPLLSRPQPHGASGGAASGRCDPRAVQRPCISNMAASPAAAGQ